MELRKGARKLVVLLAINLVLLSSSFSVALAGRNRNQCTLKLSLKVERVGDDNLEEDWSFIVLTEVDGEKAYRRIEVAPSGESTGETDEELHINSVDTLVEGKYYTLRSTEYTGKTDIFLGLQAAGDGGGSGFGSTEFSLLCGQMFHDEIENAVMSTFEWNEFRVTAREFDGGEIKSETTWKVSTYLYYSGIHKPRFRLEDLTRPLGVLLWLGWSAHVIF